MMVRLVVAWGQACSTHVGVACMAHGDTKQWGHDCTAAVLLAWRLHSKSATDGAYTRIQIFTSHLAPDLHHIAAAPAATASAANGSLALVANGATPKDLFAAAVEKSSPAADEVAAANQLAGNGGAAGGGPASAAVSPLVPQLGRLAQQGYVMEPDGVQLKVCLPFCGRSALARRCP